MKKIWIILMIFYSFQCFSEVNSNYLKENFVVVEGGILKTNEMNKQLLKKPNEDIKLTYNYYVAKYEFTQGDWERIFGKQYHIYRKDKEAEMMANKYTKKDKKLPITNITWFESINFCNLMSKKDGFPMSYDKKGNLLDEKGNITTDITKVKGYRLLTWSEWEFAARGGKYSKGYKFSGSNNINEVAWIFSDDAEESPNLVGQKKSNELGIYDMTGNVMEMCTDYLYSMVNNINPLGTVFSEKVKENFKDNKYPDNEARVVKGGAGKAYRRNLNEVLKSYDPNYFLWIDGEDRSFEPRPGILEVDGFLFTANDYTGFRIGKTENEVK